MRVSFERPAFRRPNGRPLAEMMRLPTKKIRITVALPADVLDAADRTVRTGGARSRNKLMAAALRREFGARQREVIDGDIADMADDVEYLKELGQLMREFGSGCARIDSA